MIEHRTAGPDDVDAVLAFWAGAAENAGRPTDTADAVRALIARDPDALLLAVVTGDADSTWRTDSSDGGRVVGTLVAGWDGWRAHLYRLAVAPDHRGRGVGRALVDRAEQRLAGFGAGRVDAMVLDDNTEAHAAWRALGYTPQPDWSRWVRSPA